MISGDNAEEVRKEEKFLYTAFRKVVRSFGCIRYVAVLDVD